VPHLTVLIVGASDLGTACALRLFRSGLHVIIIEKDCPLDIYHARSFSNAVFSGSKTIDAITAKTYAQVLEEDALNSGSTVTNFIQFAVLNREIPVLTESDKVYLNHSNINYCIVCEPVLYKKIIHALPEETSLIGFASEKKPDSYAYTICNSGANFGRVFYANDALLNTTSDISLNKKEKYQQIKAPLEGVFQSSKSIDELIHEKEEIGKVDDIPILSPFLGRISGVLNSGVIISAGTVFAEIDVSHSGLSGHFLSRDSFCLAGAVLEAVMYDSKLK